MRNKKILVLSPHTDDGELGAGGCIYQSIKNGAEVFYVAFSDCKKSILGSYDTNILKKECIQSTKILGINKIQILNFDVRVFTDKRQHILDKLIELKTVCHCGSKATMVIRLNEQGIPVKEGAQVEIGGNDRYLSVCRKHFKEAVRD